MQKAERVHFGVGVVAIPIISVGFTMLDTHPLIASILFVVGGGAFVWGIWPFVFHKKRRKAKSSPRTMERQSEPLPTINYEKLDSVTPQDKKVIGSMGTRMFLLHGHQDLTGLLSDRANGISLNDLMAKPCSVCGVVRNKKGRNV